MVGEGHDTVGMGATDVTDIEEADLVGEGGTEVIIELVAGADEVLQPVTIITKIRATMTITPVIICIQVYPKMLNSDNLFNLWDFLFKNPLYAVFKRHL